MDPWVPQKSAPLESALPLPLPPETNRHEFTSEQYLAVIEGKLKKLKGSANKEPLAKDILLGLDKFKDCQMHSVVSDTDCPYVSNSEYESNNSEQSAFQSIQRRMAPEKQPINHEEVKPLVDNDVLAQMHQILSQHNEEEKNL